LYARLPNRSGGETPSPPLKKGEASGAIPERRDIGDEVAAISRGFAGIVDERFSVIDESRDIIDEHWDITHEVRR
jgi:hypothetical protein